MDNEAVSFEGRFGGTPIRCISRPAPCWRSMRGRTARGMVFELEPPVDDDEEGRSRMVIRPETSRRGQRSPGLKVVK